MPQTDESLIKSAVERYIVAMSTGDEHGLRAAFHPAASVIGNYQGAVEWLSVDAYVGEVLGAGLPPNSKPRFSISLVDVTGDAATVKVEDEFGTMRFTDYLSLLRSAGEWTIVNKVYFLHP